MSARDESEKPGGLTPDSFMRWWPVVVRVSALIGVAHQAVFARLDRPYLLGLYGTMMGVTEIVDALLRRGRDEGK